MKLEVLLPSGVFADKSGVSRIVVETNRGSFGILEHRADCIAALVPGILIYESAADGEICLAVDEGLLVKAGAEVRVSVRSAFGGSDLAGLRQTVAREFVAKSQEEQSLRDVSHRLEAGFLRRLGGLRHD